MLIYRKLVDYYKKLWGKKMERSEWEVPYNGFTISGKVLNILKAAISLSSQKTPNYLLEDYQDNTFYKFKQNFPYTSIDIAVDNPAKISGIGFNIYQSMAFNDYLSQNVNLNQKYIDICNEIPSVSFRKEKGTFIKVGKLLQVICPELFNSSLGDAFANLLRKNVITDTSSVKVSNKPSEIYTMNHSDRGNIYESCMKGKYKKRFELYDVEDFNIAYITEGTTLIARAIIYDNARLFSGENIKIMDRIYSDKSDTEYILKNWAEKNGYWYKVNQSASCDDFVNPENSNDCRSLKFYLQCSALEDHGYEELPFLDTICNYDNRKKILHNDDNEYCVTYLRDTCGGDDENFIIDSNNITCYSCGNTFNPDRENMTEINGDYYCEDCRNENFSYCESCDDFVNIDNIYEVDGEYLCESCYDHYTSECDICGNRHSDNNLNSYNFSDGTRKNVCGDCESDLTYCERCDIVISNGDEKELNDEILCEECYNDATVE